MWWVPDFAIDKYRDTLVQLRHPDARRRPPRRSLGPTPDRSTTTRGPVSHLSEQAQVLAAGSVVCSLPRIRRPTSETTGTLRPADAPTHAVIFRRRVHRMSDGGCTTWRVDSACREASEALVALSVLVYERTGSGLITAAVNALTFLPALFGSVLLGPLADRLPRRALTASPRFNHHLTSLS